MYIMLKINYRVQKTHTPDSPSPVGLPKEFLLNGLNFHQPEFNQAVTDALGYNSMNSSKKLFFLK